MHERTIPQPGWSFEYIMWIFTRISGLTLLFLGLLGLIAALIMGARTEVDLPTLLRWTFFPNPNHVVNSNIPDVTVGWANAYWQIIEMLAVFFGVSHGYNGLRVIVEDYIGHSFLQPMLRGGVFMLWLFTLVLSFYVILAS
jgi:succinate dehydrogenase / fumarate reductase membrane anchor subunit